MVRLRGKSCRPTEPIRGPGARRGQTRGSRRRRVPFGAAGAAADELLSRRVWGQRPGQPCATRPASDQSEEPVDVIVSSRNVEVTDALRAAATDKIGRLERFLEGMDHA